MNDMKQLKHRIKKLDPVLKIKEKNVDVKARQWKSHKEMTDKILEELNKKKSEYMEWVSRSNETRNGKNAEFNPMIESGIELLKSQCYTLFKKFHLMQKKEQECHQELLDARKELEASEKMQGKIQNKVDDMKRKQEQKSLDELASIRSSNNQRTF